MVRKLISLLGNLLAAVTGAGLLARFLPPDFWWPPSIIALLLPGLLLLTLLFVVWCFYRKWRKALIFPVLVLVAALPLATRLFSFGAGGNSGARGDTVTLITTNVRAFKNDIWESVSEELSFRFINQRKPDVLLLQETRNDGSDTPYFTEIKEASGLAKRHQPTRRTVATYADELDFVADKFSGAGGYNGFLVTDVKTKLGTIRVINAHLQSNRITKMAGEVGTDGDMKNEIDRAESMLRSYGAAAAIRANQAEEIRRYVRESPHPVIIGGDFNDVPSSYTYQRILTPRLRDAWVEKGFGMGTTFTGPLPGLRIDFLLVDTSLNLVEMERFDTGFSDHRGLSVEVQKRRE
ncbi:endonuclease/exonuclease/phosphatase family protein [Neolewinella aurantiaca]|uniref:endonuclease/exonuclease/phosphatase family protein n=1 Tax=Neolewinella aurantiaca TaxID=2602767 RepID=UPI001650A66B|nr:endonuclease/exonuclease/phosphatase family protein [Neolewinella aurantiaca]